MHTLLLKEHNHIARKLAEVNQHWNDDRLFDEARRILIALYQHISYYEWLPMLIGKTMIIFITLPAAFSKITQSLMETSNSL